MDPLIKYIQSLGNELRPPLYQRFRPNGWESTDFDNPFVPVWRDLKLGARNKKASIPGVIRICNRSVEHVVGRLMSILDEAPDSGDFSGLKSDCLGALSAILGGGGGKSDVKSLSQNWEVFLKLIVYLRYGPDSDLLQGGDSFYGLNSTNTSLVCYEQRALPLRDGGGSWHTDERLRLALEESELWLFQVVRLIRNEAHSARKWSRLELEIFKHLVIGALVVLVDRNYEHLNISLWVKQRAELGALVSEIVESSVLPVPIDRRVRLRLRRARGRASACARRA